MEGEGVSFLINLVVALKVTNPKIPRIIIVKTPAINDFICPILYGTLSNDCNILNYLT